MSATRAPDAWDSGEVYERYVGRWSRRVAETFVAWLQPPMRVAWADVGCGTGALTSAILGRCDPATVVGIDSSPDFVDQARRRVADPRVRFETGDATRLPWADDVFDFAVSGLVLNFVPAPDAMVSEMSRVTKRDGVVALYVWDYAEGMQMMRAFWDAAAEVHPAAAEADEARRFPICQPERLAALFTNAGLAGVATTPIDIETLFTDFDDYWAPFLGKTGPAPAYLASLPEAVCGQIRDRLAVRLPTSAEGRIALSARAWAVRGAVTAHATG
jgi:SAM-dependent methyltransferase